MGIQIRGTPWVSDLETLGPADFERILKQYNCAEDAYKDGGLRQCWNCPRCTAVEEQSWVCAFGRGITFERTHGIRPQMCGTCVNNTNNLTFDLWEPNACLKGAPSKKPCQECESKENGKMTWRPSPPPIIQELLGNLYKNEEET